jgi:hypothetical protein
MVMFEVVGLYLQQIYIKTSLVCKVTKERLADTCTIQLKITVG